jgi:microcystin-dependent protein
MDYFLGQLNIFPYSFAPRDWMLCDGRELPIIHNAELFSLLGAKFGGDGIQTFCIPNLQGAEAIPGTAYYICVAGAYPSKE